MVGDQLSDWTQANRDDPCSSRAVTDDKEGNSNPVGSKRSRESSLRLLAIAEAASVSLLSIFLFLFLFLWDDVDFYFVHVIS
jgi:hypothetical protein